MSHANIYEKYEPTYSPTSKRQIVGQIGLFSLGITTGLKEGKTCLNLLKINLKSYRAHIEGLVNTEILGSRNPVS